MRNSIGLGLLGALLLSACGPAGIISGKVTVEGGNAADIAVIVYGPQSAATVTAADPLETYVLGEAEFRAAIEQSASFRDQLRRVYFMRH